MRSFLLKYRWWLAAACPVLFCAFVYCVLALGVSAFESVFVEPKLEAMKLEVQQVMPKILADAKLLASAPIFPETTRAKDATALLASHISWEGTGGAPNSQSQALEGRLDKDYKGWKTDAAVREKLLKDQAFWNDADTSWINELIEHDHFSIETHPAAKAMLDRLPEAAGIERVEILASLAMPSYSEIRVWATVHALKLAREGRAVEGLKAYRKIAFLLNTSNTLVGAMSAVAMLKSERFIKDAFHANDWQLLPDSALDAYKRFAWASVMLTKAPFLVDLPTELETLMKPSTGLCIGASESIGGPLILQEFLEPRAPLESDHRPMMAALRERQQRYFDLCGMKAYKALLAPPSPSAMPWILTGSRRLFDRKAIDLSSQSPGWNDQQEVPDREGAELNASKIPFVRRAIALMIITISSPNWLKLYGEPNAQ